MSDGWRPSLVCRAACLVLKRQFQLWLNHLKPQCSRGELNHRFFLFKSNCLRLKPLIHCFHHFIATFLGAKSTSSCLWKPCYFGGGIHFSILYLNSIFWWCMYVDLHVFFQKNNSGFKVHRTKIRDALGVHTWVAPASPEAELFLLKNIQDFMIGFWNLYSWWMLMGLIE